MREHKFKHAELTTGHKRWCMSESGNSLRVYCVAGYEGCIQEEIRIPKKILKYLMENYK